MPVSTDKAQEQAELNAVPIREISRLTGINSITLRAWERRYGLLKPLRTAKGHRLYRPEDVERVREIQSWLTRGLAIGKIKHILAASEQEKQVLALDNVWHEKGDRLRQILSELNRRKLESLLAELTSVYPAEVLADELFAPLFLHQWQLAMHYGDGCQRAFFEGALREHFYSGLRRQRQLGGEQHLLVLDLCGQEPGALALTLSYGLSVKGYVVECMGDLASTECVFALERWGSQAVIVYADSRVAGLEQKLYALRQLSSVPVFLAGQMTALYQAQTIVDVQLLGQRHQQIHLRLAEELERLEY